MIPIFRYALFAIHKSGVPTYVNGTESIDRSVYAKILMARVSFALDAYKARLGLVFMCIEIKLFTTLVRDRLVDRLSGYVRWQPWILQP